MLPKRRKPSRLGLKDRPQARIPGHLQFVRGHECSINSALCDGPIEAAHARSGTDGALGVKPSDWWALPLCALHHRIQHDIGEKQFEHNHSIDMKKIAQALWQRSPHRRKWEDG